MFVLVFLQLQSSADDETLLQHDFNIQHEHH